MNNYRERQRDAEAWRDIFRGSVGAPIDTKELVEQGNHYSKLGNDLEAIMCYRLASIRGDEAAKQAEENERHKMDWAAERKSIYPDVTARNWLRVDVPFGVSMEGCELINQDFERVKICRDGINYCITHERTSGMFSKPDRISIGFSETDIQEIKYERVYMGRSELDWERYWGQCVKPSLCRHTIEITLTNKNVRLFYEPNSILGIPLNFRHTESVVIW
jgi:hypothetical protein